MTKPVLLVSDASKISNGEDNDEFDFVFVEREFEGRTIIDGDNDVDSYDCCEDVYSILSRSSEEENNGDVYLFSENIDDEIALLPLKDSDITVPLGLLKDLDEAHEAAKLTRITDLDGIPDLVTTCSDDDCSIGAEGKVTLSSPTPQKSEAKKDEKEPKCEENFVAPRSPSTLSTNTNDIDDIEVPSILAIPMKPNEINTSKMVENSIPKSRAIIIVPAVDTESNSSSIQRTATAPCVLVKSIPGKDRTEKAEKNSSDDKGTSSINKKVVAAPVSKSRASNKKRRKKLKLLKKAKAAENFQQQAAFAIQCAASQGKASKKLKHAKKQNPTVQSCRISRKVSNVAVSCAIQSMSKYREELAVQQGK